MFGLIVEADKLEVTRRAGVGDRESAVPGPGRWGGREGRWWGVFKGGDGQLAQVVKEAREGKMVFRVGRQ